MKVEELKKYVTLNKRICPVPLVWNKFLKILELEKKIPASLMPLILNGWGMSSDLDKRNRILAQIDYASRNKEIFDKLEKLILSMKERDWYYGSEPPSEEITGLI